MFTAAIAKKENTFASVFEVMLVCLKQLFLHDGEKNSEKKSCVLKLKLKKLITERPIESQILGNLWGHNLF